MENDQNTSSKKNEFVKLKVNEKSKYENKLLNIFYTIVKHYSNINNQKLRFTKMFRQVN